MKKQFLTFIFLLTIAIFSGQKLNKDQYQAIENDDVESFQKNFTENDLQKCYPAEKTSYSVLALSIKMNKPSIFNAILSKNVNLDQICDDKSPLMFTSKYNMVDFAKKLLEKGAKKDLKNNKGITAMDYAKKYDQYDMMKLLK